MRQPALTAAALTLLRHLHDRGATLRYHGDFDWGGLRIATTLLRHVPFRPWRYSTPDYLAAADAWARTELALAERIGGDVVVESLSSSAPAAPEPATREVRAWARGQGILVPERGRLRPEIWQAWRDAQQP